MLILDTNYCKLFLHGRSIQHPQALFAKEILSKQLKVTAALATWDAIAKQPMNVQYILHVLFPFPATTPHKTAPAIGNLESLDYGTSRARGPQAKGK